jgi:hypothetical protein
MLSVLLLSMVSIHVSFSLLLTIAAYLLVIEVMMFEDVYCVWQIVLLLSPKNVNLIPSTVPSAFHRNVLWMQAEPSGIFLHTRLFI